MRKSFGLSLIAGVCFAVQGCVGYYDNEPCADGSTKRRIKPRHGPSIFVCPDEAQTPDGEGENDVNTSE